VVKVKICGIRRLVEAQAALEHGADYLGFVFHPPSHRSLAPEAAADLVAQIRAECVGRQWEAVGVFVNEPVGFVNDVAERCGLDLVQLHGTEGPDYCAAMRRPVIKALRVSELSPEPTSAAHYGAVRLLLDAQLPGYWGGTGVRFDWEAARPYAREALIAGGLSPANVGEALATLAPWGIDVSSGVERDRVKDPALIRAFLERVRECEASRDN
jgi:phosphoribosylanthranilate isomerase